MGMLFFTSPIGLGHATRDAAIAERLGAGRRGAVFVTGGPAANLLSEYGYAVLDVYRPPPFDVGAGRLRHAALWLGRYMSYHYRCRRIASGIIERYKPNMIVSDEDFASLAVYGGRKVLITDILESRFTSGLSGMVERRLNRSMGHIISGCDAVIMPQDGPDRGNVRSVGPIVRRIEETRQSLRDRYHMGRKTILVTVGGTAAGRFLLDAMRPVSAALSGVADTVTAAGPALGGGVRDLHKMIYAADVVVSLAGRSTMDEAAAYGTPGVFIPISGHFEQEANAARAGYGHGDLHRLRDILSEMLERPAARAPLEGAQEGAGRAARIISQYLI